MINKEKIKFLRSLHTRAGRTEAGVFIAEGEKLVDELTKTVELCELYRVGENCSEAQMARISMLKTPSTVLATFRIPIFGHSELRGRALVLDGVQDPGNVGTILRTAQWFGIRTIVCSPTCADIYSPKVVQATMGALGNMEVVYTDVVRWIAERKRECGSSVYGTFLLDAVDVRGVGFSSDAVIVVGSEGGGISAEVGILCDHRVTIPRVGNSGGESLNVGIATAIVLYECIR